MPVMQAIMMYRSAGVVNHTVSISPNPAGGASTTPSPAEVSPTANVLNGVGPFTYLWSITSGGAGVTLTNTTSATCTLTTNNGNIQVRTGTLKCDVTDTGNGSIVASDTVTYTLEVT